jgi:hypothetical protein
MFFWCAVDLHLDGATGSLHREARYFVHVVLGEVVHFVGANRE